MLVQIRTVSSELAEAMRVPSGLITKSLTSFLCPINLKGLISGLKFQTMTEPSLEPDATFLRLGLKTIDVICPL